MGWIRWPGLTAFAGFVALLVVFSWLFVDVLVERAIEQTGTALVGARVDVAAVSVTFSPAGFELQGLEVTDPEAPMTNAVEVARIAGSFDALQALRRKLVVEELSLEGVRFGTPRQRSGAIDGYRPRLEAASLAVEQAVQQIALPSFDFPDPEEILAEEELETLAEIAAMRTAIDETRTRWQERLAALPDEQDLESYRARIDGLRQAGTLAAVAQGVQLAKDLREDLEQLEEAAGGLERELDELEARARAVKEAPARDLARLQERYGLSAQGLGNLTERLLAGRVRSVVSQALAWYERVAPFVEQASTRLAGDGPEVVERLRGRSVLVRYTEREPTPDLLIRHVKASIELDAGDFQGTIQNITPDQAILGLPLVLDFAGEGLDGIRSIRLEGQLDHIRQGSPRDQLKATVRGYAVEELILSSDETWPIRFGGDVDVDVSVSLAGEALQAELGLALRGRLLTDFDDSLVATALADTLAGVDSLRLDIAVGGTRAEPNIQIRSDLDRVLASAVSGLVSGQLKRFEAKLGSAIGAQIGGPVAALDGSLAGLDVLSGDIASRQNLANELLAQALAGGVSGSGFRLPGGLRIR